MDIALLYFDGCPNWTVADQRLTEIVAERPDIALTRHRVHTIEDAERVGFHGSPSILVTGSTRSPVGTPASGWRVRCMPPRTGQPATPQSTSCAQ